MRQVLCMPFKTSTAPRTRGASQRRSWATEAGMLDGLRPASVALAKAESPGLQRTTRASRAIRGRDAAESRSPIAGHRRRSVVVSRQPARAAIIRTVTGGSADAEACVLLQAHLNDLPQRQELPGSARRRLRVQRHQQGASAEGAAREARRRQPLPRLRQPPQPRLEGTPAAGDQEAGDRPDARTAEPHQAPGPRPRLRGGLRVRQGTVRQGQEGLKAEG